MRRAYLRATEASVAVLGSGWVTVHASDRLDVTIAGSGSVRYLGQPDLHTTILGTGTVLRDDG